MTNDLFPLRMWDSAELSTVSFLVCHCKLEPLAVVLVTSQVVSISRGGLEHKLALYAVDLLLFISSPDRSIPVLLACCKLKTLWGLQTKNFDKRDCFPINDAISACPQSNLPFRRSLESFKSVGVCRFKCNSSPLLVQLSQDLLRWSLLPLSFAGMRNGTKMNVLPKFLYVFQCIPVFIPKYFPFT